MACLFFYLGIRYLVANPRVLTSGAGWVLALGVTVLVLWAGIPMILDGFFRKRVGWGDGKCPVCGGGGRARYELGRYGISEVCRTCKGSGSGPGGPGREDEE